MSHDDSPSPNSPRDDRKVVYIGDIAKRWLVVKNQLDKLEEEKDEIKKELETYLRSIDAKKAVIEGVCISRIERTTETVTKAKVPQDVWKKYAVSKKISYISVVRSRAKK